MISRNDDRSVQQALTALDLGGASNPSCTIFQDAALAQGSDPLPSWNDGAAKQTIINCAGHHRSIEANVCRYRRVVTFDQDGTLWVEHPMYTQVMYRPGPGPSGRERRPQLADAEPFKTVLSRSHRTAPNEGTRRNPLRYLSSMMVNEFNAEHVDRNGQTFALGSTLYRIDLSTHAGDFWATSEPTATSSPVVVRTLSARILSGRTPSGVVGTAGGTKYSYDKDGKPILSYLARSYIRLGA